MGGRESGVCLLKYPMTCCCRDDPYHWDYFVYTQQWPQGACIDANNSVSTIESNSLNGALLPLQMIGKFRSMYDKSVFVDSKCILAVWWQAGSRLLLLVLL